MRATPALRGVLTALMTTVVPWVVYTSPVAAESVVLIDDLGKPVVEDLEVCVTRDLATECTAVEASEGSSISLEPFHLLRVEGPKHGPATARPGELEEIGDGRVRMTVPRKARLRISGLPEAPVTVSLYAVDDPEARLPQFRYELSGSKHVQELFVPAGDHLTSFTRQGAAPDLHAFSAPPGGTVGLRYLERAGWSLALRTLSPEDESPVPGSKVALATPPAEGSEEADLPEARSNSLGFALFSGLTPHIVHATIQHPEFVENQALGLSANPGTFDLYHAVLERGGTIEVRAAVDGRARAVVCSLVEQVGTDRLRNPIIETLREAETDASGVCRIDRVPEGKRFVRVNLEEEESAAVVDRDIYVVEGETARLELDLSPIHLSGTVFLGEERAGAGYRVLIDHMVAHGPGGTGDPSLSLETDESGEYSGTLWTASDYYLALVSPSGVGAGSQRAFLSGPSEVVDFHISSREIRGRVVDQEGEPVEGAAVALTWNVMSHVGTRTGTEGDFAFPLREEEGEARLFAHRIGEPPGEPVTISVSPGEPIPPVVFALPDPQHVVGRLLSAYGQPVSGGRVWSYRSSNIGAPTPVGSDTTGPDGSFAVPPAADAPTWIYASGPGCPLSLHALPPLADGEVAELRCPDAASALRLHMLDANGDGFAGRRLILRHDGNVIPSEVLAGHLASLGLPAGSDGRGRLVLAGVAPGDYDLYLRDSSNEATVAQGLRYGFVTSTTLQPLAAADLEIVVHDAR